MGANRLHVRDRILNRRLRFGPTDRSTHRADRSKPRNTNYVYGSGRHSSKSRRCGECEGCMKDDCGDCAACRDKPRFGGKGTKKRACVARVCRMKQASRVRRPSSQQQLAAPEAKRPRMEMQDEFA